MDILKRALIEIEASDYELCSDRVLAMFDRARRSLVPARGRTSEQHAELTDAYQAATVLLGQILKPNGEMTEELAYFELTKLGKVPISLHDHRILLERAIAQLEHESMPTLVNA